MDWFNEGKLAGPAAELYRKLRTERILWDTTNPAERQKLDRDAQRIAAEMDSPHRSPPMFWSGIPWPAQGPEPTCDYQLVISTGGTKTDFALLRLEKGRVIGLDVLTGKEITDPEEIHRVKTATQMGTPKFDENTRTGQEMIARMVRHLAPHVKAQRAAFERCGAVFLSWGFPHAVIRTGPKLAGGLSARVTKMTKDQADFTPSLLGKDVGKLFEEEFRNQLGWTRPVAVANDTVMALHYFLGPDRRAGHARVGLFINGTGTNFSAAEPYAIRKDGFLSHDGEDYIPDRLTAYRPLRSSEHEELFFVNYEAGSIELVTTLTRFDTDPEYPLERNALAGGNAFSQQLRAYVNEFVSPQAYEKLSANWREMAKDPKAVPAGPAVSLIAGQARDVEMFAGFGSEPGAVEGIRLIARAIVTRSALHAALVLAAITKRTRFGLGSGGLPDLLGMEGSVWKSPNYQGLVHGFWQDLVGEDRLSVTFAAEPSFNASLPGPLYLAAIHRG